MERGTYVKLLRSCILWNLLLTNEIAFDCVCFFAVFFVRFLSCSCGQEFHLKCCTPPIQVVPEGAFYCFDCSPKGSTEQLEDYLLEHERWKDDHPDDIWVDVLLRDDIRDEPQHHPPDDSNNNTEQDEDDDEEDNATELFPRSELHWIHREHPERLIGNPLRLYCPHGNHYHNGRILEVRPGNRNTDHLVRNGRVLEVRQGGRDTECLVRFPAGKDYRKTSLTTWIRLEEHCLAVATQILWGVFGSKERKKSNVKKSSSSSSPAKWMRAKLWSRTARELVPVLQLLNPKEGQLYYRNPNDDVNDEEPTQPKWGLVETFGTDTYELLNLPLETRDSRPQPPKKNALLLQEDEREADIRMALAQAELEEQARIRNWKEYPMLNPVHPAAIRCQDEYALGPLEFRRRERQYVRPSPLISQGLDRAYILEQVSQRLGVPPSKDLASSLACELTNLVPSTIGEINRYQQRLSNNN
jgi:hypothetical protein